MSVAEVGGVLDAGTVLWNLSTRVVEVLDPKLRLLYSARIAIPSGKFRARNSVRKKILVRYTPSARKRTYGVYRGRDTSASVKAGPGRLNSQY